MDKLVKASVSIIVVLLGVFVFVSGLLGIIRIASPEFPPYLGMLLMTVGSISTACILTERK
ncbi:hypothetical protein SUSAZ_00850 [Sulfolobus acidocaldarius SUSAZ]|nr:hypothetical protein SUSAZ_00850 [Sulfolobus acidocaldarius SUSAZ]